MRDSLLDLHERFIGLKLLLSSCLLLIIFSPIIRMYSFKLIILPKVLYLDVCLLLQKLVDFPFLGAIIQQFELECLMVPTLLLLSFRWGFLATGRREVDISSQIHETVDHIRDEPGKQRTVYFEARISVALNQPRLHVAIDQEIQPKQLKTVLGSIWIKY